MLKLANKINKIKYKNMLTAMATLSKLSSESSIPYLGYREVENIYCKAFDAENISRVDCSADAAKNGIGIGIKTFIEGNGKSLQKVAEFNKDMDMFRGKTPREVVNIISNLRNERINATKRIYGLTNMIYHCVVRSVGQIKVFECPMDLINIKTIKNISFSSKNTITFEDDLNEYSINISKSTLYKRFLTKDVILEFSVKILQDPYEVITNLLNTDRAILKFAPIVEEKEHIFLPLYSDRGGRNVPEKSGLNQWNAGGRKRNPDEVYIPIPAWIHQRFNGFFPSKDKAFDLILPDKNVISAKVCQDGGKALMSNPNQDLGKWILRNVMNLGEQELLTYERLAELGVDSVVIYKENSEKYSINFTTLGSFDRFKEEI
ncbi:NgoFVII family restriction endonuclease [Clostridium botulinum]|uniref:restriction endonuclease PLD domain-containing protein n=1 Tax=Clostridium botulinum TaxID=1491 RepID=UPI001967570C|nr:restriction endonuclease PLD domain-containing protein [Clostridium botulinum]MBN1072079.1 NgoFVII family restriction endonuclease [Clostridium botulinum]